MPKKLIRRFLPSPEKIKNNRSLHYLGDRIHDPNLWHLNRRSVAGAFFVGIFCAFLPIPMQMLVAGVLAMFVRCNLPISVVLVWITNPITMPAIFYFTYKVGCYLLGTPVSDIDFTMTVEWFEHELGRIWQPLYFGSIITGLFSGAVSYLTIRLYWRWHVTHSWNSRKLRKTRQQND